ncbi:uncharacterized protein LOC143834858 [Paroedura picta]|uniref:uncharacterized protein LOC143834858 n=1 Tax=Paroedura picta TaxID=143630 RepID=UPI00405627A8
MSSVSSSSLLSEHDSTCDVIRQTMEMDKRRGLEGLLAGTASCHASQKRRALRSLQLPASRTQGSLQFHPTSQGCKDRLGQRIRLNQRLFLEISKNTFLKTCLVFNISRSLFPCLKDGGSLTILLSGPIPICMKEKQDNCRTKIWLT